VSGHVQILPNWFEVFCKHHSASVKEHLLDTHRFFPCLAVGALRLGMGGALVAGEGRGAAWKAAGGGFSGGGT
jgi:hypothetical protein